MYEAVRRSPVEVAMHQLAFKAAERPEPKPKPPPPPPRPPRPPAPPPGAMSRPIAYVLCGHASRHERALELANRSWIHRLILSL
jgi:hypothetical protein